MSRYIKQFDKRKLAKFLVLMISVFIVARISDCNFNAWISFALYSIIPVVTYIFLYFILSKIIRFQFKIDDLMAIYPGYSKTDIKSIALTFSLWLSLSLTCTFMWTIALQHHIGIILNLGISILLAPSIFCFSYVFFLAIWQFFSKLNKKI